MLFFFFFFLRIVLVFTYFGQEPLCTDVLYPVSSHLSRLTCSNIPSIRQALAIITVDMLYWKFILGLGPRRFSRLENLRNAQQSHPIIGVPSFMFNLPFPIVSLTTHSGKNA